MSKESSPAPWLIKLLALFCPDYLFESIIGDLLEQYALNRERKSKLRSDCLFIYNGLRFLRFSILRRRNSRSTANRSALFFNYLLLALRNLKKQKQYQLINFTGLTLGLSCCALVLLYASHELSYDNFHPDSKNTYRVTGEINQRAWFPSVSNDYAEQLETDQFPEIQKTVKFRRAPENFAVYGDKRFGTRSMITNPGSRFFDIFNFNTLEGDKATMLEAPNSVILNESTATKLLGEPPHVGKIIEWDTLTLRVSGIIEDLPSNTHLTFNMMIAADIPFFGVFTYVVLNDQADIKALEEKIVNIDLPENRFPYHQIALQPLESIHFAAPLTFELKPPGNKRYLFLFVGIAAFILIISCTNYMNLSAAIYGARTKEMAIRKVLGSSKKAIAGQFLLESVLMAFMTLPAVILIIEALLPALSDFTGTPLENLFLSSPRHIGLLVLITLITSLVAGLYPVLTMSNISSLKLFKDSLANAHGLRSRKVLLTLQFTILIFLGTGAWFINQQLQFIENKDLGIDREGIVKVSNIYNLADADKYNTIKTLALGSPHILGFTTGTPPGTETLGMAYQAEGHEVRNDALSFSTDFDYFEVMGVKGAYGDFFEKTPDQLPDLSLLVSEKFVEVMGWETPIGKKVTFNPGPNSRDRFISGVFEDYHALSLHEEIVPQFIFATKRLSRGYENILVKINMQHVSAAFQAIEDAWYAVMPESPIYLEFMDDDIQAAYEQEQKAGTLSMILSVLAVSLAIMGLVGLSAYMAQLRTKEVGIRKVLGAPVKQILFLMNREFMLLITIATLIASSLSYYAVSLWLDTFVYRTSINVLIFGLAGILVLIITFTTVSIQSARTAMQNPVRALRHE
jgi:putative ABC transport system permease protein